MQATLFGPIYFTPILHLGNECLSLTTPAASYQNTRALLLSYHPSHALFPTVRENLLFACKMYGPDMSQTQCEQRVDEVVVNLGLEDCQDTKVSRRRA